MLFFLARRKNKNSVVCVVCVCIFVCVQNCSHMLPIRDVLIANVLCIF